MQCRIYHFEQNGGLNLAPLRFGTKFKLRLDFLKSFPFPFPTIPGNTSVSFPFPKVGKAIFIPVPIPKYWECNFYSRSHSQKLGMQFFIPIPVPKIWEWVELFPFRELDFTRASDRISDQLISVFPEYFGISRGMGGLQLEVDK